MKNISELYWPSECELIVKEAEDWGCVIARRRWLKPPQDGQRDYLDLTAADSSTIVYFQPKSRVISAWEIDRSGKHAGYFSYRWTNSGPDIGLGAAHFPDMSRLSYTALRGLTTPQACDLPKFPLGCVGLRYKLDADDNGWSRLHSLSAVTPSDTLGPGLTPLEYYCGKSGAIAQKVVGGPVEASSTPHIDELSYNLAQTRDGIVRFLSQPFWIKPRLLEALVKSPVVPEVEQLPEFISDCFRVDLIQEGFTPGASVYSFSAPLFIAGDIAEELFTQCSLDVQLPAIRRLGSLLSFPAPEAFKCPPLS